MGSSSGGNGRPALTALAAGAAVGLTAAAAAAVMERLRRNPVLTRGGRFFPDARPGANAVPVGARKDPNLPGWKQGMPGSAERVRVEVSSLDAGTGSPRRTWIVHNGPEWQSQPGELMVPPEHTREAD
ncbi:MAG: hypothetical protein ABS910_14710 [Arthrobacter sp.]